MQQKSIKCQGPSGFHTMRYFDFDDESGKPLLLCLHGMARSGRDFLDLASAAATEFRVVCPDLAGMGTSDYLSSPDEYEAAGWDLYVHDIATLLQQLDARRVAILGTSLGGIVAMKLAAKPASPVAALVLNDVGAYASRASFERFNCALASDPRFLNLIHAEQSLRIACRDVGELDAESWRRFSADSVQPDGAGAYRLAFDPQIAMQKKWRHGGDVELWEDWSSIRCPVLIVRGANSKLLTEETVARMTATGKLASSLTILGCGHSPHLRTPDHYGLVLKWLRALPR